MSFENAVDIKRRQKVLGAIAALCHERWEKGENPGEIIGYWAEDFSPYKITVPHQLRDLVLGMHKTYRNAYLERKEHT